MRHVLPKKSCALRHMIHRVFLGVCAVASLNACHGRSSAPRQRPSASPPTTTQPPATSRPISVAPKKTARFQQARAVWAHAYRLTERLAPLAPKSFVRLDDAKQARLRDLQDKSAIVLKVYTTGDRLLVIFPATHPEASMRLIFLESSDSIVAHMPNRQTYILPLERLPDLLDHTQPSRRRRPRRPSITSVNVPPAVIAKARARDLLEALRLTTPTRYERPGDEDAPPWHLMTTLTVFAPGHVSPEHLAPSPLSRAIYRLALPLALLPKDARLGRLLRSLSPTPRGWIRVVDNQSATEVPPLRLAVTLEDRGWVSMPARHFATTQSGYRRMHRQDPPTQAGVQTLPVSRLVHLRPGVPGASLLVHNPSAVAAFVYIDGVRLGWVSPEHKLRFEGMPQGYYRVFARSPSGVRSWGPRDMYLPGELRLR